MSNTSVIIMADGQQARWEGEGYKQLLPVGNEKIMQRVIRQARQRGYDPVIMTSKDALAIEGARVFTPSLNLWKVQSLTFWLQSIIPQPDRYVVLLGDTVYSKSSMDRILACDAPLMFFGNYAEIFALVFTPEKMEKVFFHCQRCVTRCMSKGDKGTLHSLFRSLNGLPWEGSVERTKDTSPHFTFLTCDYTRDVDTQEEYDKLISEVVTKGKLDDL